MGETSKEIEAEFNRIMKAIGAILDIDANKELKALNKGEQDCFEALDVFKIAATKEFQECGDWPATIRKGTVATYEKLALEMAQRVQDRAGRFVLLTNTCKSELRAIKALSARVQDYLEKLDKKSKVKPQFKLIDVGLDKLLAQYKAFAANADIFEADLKEVAKMTRLIADFSTDLVKDFIKTRNAALADADVSDLEPLRVNRHKKHIKRLAAAAMAALDELEDAKKKVGPGFIASLHKAYDDVVQNANEGIALMKKLDAAEKNAKAGKKYKVAWSDKERKEIEDMLVDMRGFRDGLLDRLEDLKKL